MGLTIADRRKMMLSGKIRLAALPRPFFLGVRCIDHDLHLIPAFST